METCSGYDYQMPVLAETGWALQLNHFTLIPWPSVGLSEVGGRGSPVYLSLGSGKEGEFKLRLTGISLWGGECLDCAPNL